MSSPPFGSWTKGIDMVFLELACQVSDLPFPAPRIDAPTTHTTPENPDCSSRKRPSTP